MCGRCGRLYTLRAARAIGGEGFAAIHPGLESRLSACQSKVPTCAEVFALAAQGDAMARDIVDRATYVLGAALAGLAHVLDPNDHPGRTDFRGKRHAAARAVAERCWLARTLPAAARRSGGAIE